MAPRSLRPEKRGNERGLPVAAWAGIHHTAPFPACVRSRIPSYRERISGVRRCVTVMIRQSLSPMTCSSIFSAVSLSRLAVNSSNSSTRLFLSSAQARLKRCFSPPEKFLPFSSTMVESPSGRESTSSFNPACSRAASISCGVYSS